MNQMPKFGKVLILLSSVALAAACVAYAARRDSPVSAGPAPADAQIQAKPATAPVSTASPPPSAQDDGSAMRDVPPPPPVPVAPPAAEEPEYFGGSKSMPMPRRHDPSK